MLGSISTTEIQMPPQTFTMQEDGQEQGEPFCLVDGVIIVDPFEEFDILLGNFNQNAASIEFRWIDEEAEESRKVRIELVDGNIPSDREQEVQGFLWKGYNYEIRSQVGVLEENPDLDEALQDFSVYLRENGLQEDFNPSNYDRYVYSCDSQIGAELLLLEPDPESSEVEFEEWPVAGIGFQFEPQDDAWHILRNITNEDGETRQTIWYGDSALAGFAIRFSDIANSYLSRADREELQD